MILRAASYTAEPPIDVVRELKVPVPNGIAWLSPSTTATSSTAIPSTLAAQSERNRWHGLGRCSACRRTRSRVRPDARPRARFRGQHAETRQRPWPSKVLPPSSQQKLRGRYQRNGPASAAALAAGATRDSRRAPALLPWWPRSRRNQGLAQWEAGRAWQRRERSSLS